MRIGIVSDIHCNAEALRTGLERMGPVDELLCAGDAIFEYRFSNEVIELLRERDARYVLGNHEAVFLGPAGIRAREAPAVRLDNVAYMAGQPLRIDVDLGGKRLLMVHGSPFEPIWQYLYPTTPDLRKLADVDADYVILGHTHFQMAERIGRALVVNPGSLGDPRDRRNDYSLSFAVLDTSSDEVEFTNFKMAGPVGDSGAQPS